MHQTLQLSQTERYHLDDSKVDFTVSFCHDWSKQGTKAQRIGDMKWAYHGFDILD